MSDTEDLSITGLPEQAAELDEMARKRFNTLFSVVRSQGPLVIPDALVPWVERTFGAVADVESQEIVKVLNLWTLEGGLFNSLRARRPLRARIEQGDSLAGDGSDDFCNPLERTPEDTFGRIQGQHCVTSANVAKYDGLHAVVIFDRHHPLLWTEEEVVDHFDTAARWIAAAHEARPTASYPFIMWNCLPKSGASIIHGHMQCALSESLPYGGVEKWRRAALDYRAKTGGDYFEDLYSSHHDLGLAGQAGNIRWIAHLTPVREKEILLLGSELNAELYAAVYKMLHLYVGTLMVGAFNVATYIPPLDPTPEDWSNFPVIVRIVDRGDPGSATGDVGAMELFTQSVVTFDPWRLARAIRDQY